MVLVFGEIPVTMVGEVSALVVKLTFQGSEIRKRNKQRNRIVSDSNKYCREKPQVTLKWARGITEHPVHGS